MKFNDDLMRWYVGTKEKYLAIKPDDIDINGCYFTLDTQELFLDNISYSGLLIYYSGEKPTNPSTKKLYFDIEKLNVSSYDGENWNDIFICPNGYIMGDGSSFPESVTGKGIKDYVDRFFSVTIPDMAVLDMYYNSTRNQLELHKGEQDHTIQITGIGNKIIRDSKTGQIYMLDPSGCVIASIYIPPDEVHVASGTYNDEKKAIDLLMTNNTHVYIMAADIINIYNEKSSDTMDIQCIVKDGQIVLSMQVKISKADDNSLQIKDDGLFVQCLDGIEKLSSTYENMILTATANGVNGINAITENISSILPSDKNVVTEKAVSSFLADSIDGSNLAKIKDTATVASMDNLNMS